MDFINSIAKWFQRLVRKMQKNKTFAFQVIGGVVVAIILLIVLIVAATKSAGSNEDATDEDAQQVEETQETQPEEYVVPNVALEENAYSDVNDLINRYYTAKSAGDSQTIRSIQTGLDEQSILKLEKESAYIDEYDNLKVYTKPGPIENSYIAFVYYEIKFSDIERLAPGLSTMYICAKEDGSLYINDEDLPEPVTKYIKEIVAQTDVKDLFGMVETKYADVLAEDAALKAFMEGLSAKLDEEVSQAMAQMEDDTQEGEATEETETTENVVEETVTATDTVNVRASDSENADRIGQIAMGEKVTRYEAKDNGWSRINYNGSEGYVKSEYLEAEQQAQSTEETTSADTEQQTEQQTESAPAESSPVKVTGGKITIKETVNVRKSASQSSDRLGTAYQGENYELVMEQADGWCKIKFGNDTGYVKTEFVEK